MKRIISMIAAAAVMVSSFAAVYAAPNEEAAGAMREALVKVKETVDIPEALTEFESSIYDSEGETVYSFEWHDAEENEHIGIQCDGEGRIKSYWHGDTGMYKNEGKKISPFTREQVEQYALAMLKAYVPSAFVDQDDCLVYAPDKTTAYADWGTSEYTLKLDRVKNGVKVKDNGASMNVMADDEKIFVRGFDVDFDHDAVFEQEAEKAVGDAELSYAAAFPVEMIYKKDTLPVYRMANGDGENEVKLIYRLKDGKAGYISAYTGEVVEPYYNSLFRNGGMKEEAAADAGGMGMMSMKALTPAEQEAVDNISGLKSVSETEAWLRSIPELKIDDNYKLEVSGYRKRAGKYVLNIDLSYNDENKYGYASALVDAVSGELLNLNRYNGEDDAKAADITPDKTAAAKKTVDAFLLKAAGKKLDEYSENDADRDNEDADNRYIGKSYTRMVNGVKFINNTINVGYDVIGGYVRNYNLSYDDAEFADPSGAVGVDAAYESILNYAPLTNIYVNDGDMYRLCVTALDGAGVEIDALSGERIRSGAQNDPVIYEYNDIEGHWCAEAAKALANVGIGFEGAAMMPDTEITQEELLRLFSAAVYYREYSVTDTDELYKRLTREGIITDAEDAPRSYVTREDACVFLIRMAGAERYAKLENIYKVSFADGAGITPGKLGYIALLSGMGIVCGDGGEVRPGENITRAESAMMIYNYMTK